jgi:hypothetical protein
MDSLFGAAIIHLNRRILSSRWNRRADNVRRLRQPIES